MASLQSPITMRSSALLETSCGYLLQERRKVDRANISRARLHQELAESEAEFTHLLLSLGERSLPGRPEKMTGTLTEQLDSITPALREMRLRKEERVNQFRAVQLHHLGKALKNLWNLMDTPYNDRQKFSHVTGLLSVSSTEVSESGSLTQNVIEQEMKKVQSQVVVEQENGFGSRPGTGNRRTSNGSLNGGFRNASPLNTRLSLSIQQLGSHSINSANQGISFASEGRKVQEHKMFARPGLASHFRDETASVVSTFSGPLSP